MAEKPTLESLSLNLGYSRGFPVDRAGNERKALKEYKSKHVRPKSIVVKGRSKRVQWDSNTGKIYDEKEAKKQVNLQLYKTLTPDKDYAFLSKQSEIDRKTATGPAEWRKALSWKSDDGTVVEQEHQQWLTRQTANLEKLKIGTSFETDDNPLANPGEYPSSYLRSLTKKELGIKQDIQVKKEKSDNQSTNFEGAGNNTGTEDSQQVVASDLQDSPLNTAKEQITKIGEKQAKDQLRIKSDVFTIDPKTKKMVGVLTNSQRRAFEAREDVRASLLKAQKAGNVRRYTNRDKLIRIGGG